MTTRKPIKVTPTAPKRELGQYLDEHGRLRVCKACVPNSKVRRHTCGLADLQSMFTI